MDKEEGAKEQWSGGKPFSVDQMTFEPMTWGKEKSKYKDPEATISLAVFRGIARRPVSLENELKREGKKVNQEVGWERKSSNEQKRNCMHM